MNEQLTLEQLATMLLSNVQLEQLVSLERLERSYVELVVDKCGGNKSRAARVLGISRRSLYRRLDARE